jgi:hypothetical protein
LDSDTLKKIEERIAKGTYEAPAGFRNEVEKLPVDQIPAWFKQNILATTVSMVEQNTRLLLGTSVADMATALLVALTQARESKNPQSLIQACTLGVFVGFTVSREWILEYSSMIAPNIYTKFEIDGRSASADDKGVVRDNWVTASRMNSTAVHWVGHMIVEMAPANSVLGKLRAAKGTVFSPPPQSVVGEQADITRAASMKLTQQDSQAFSAVRGQFDLLIPVISALFGTAGVNVDAALKAAALVRLREF